MQAVLLLLLLILWLAYYMQQNRAQQQQQQQQVLTSACQMPSTSHLLLLHTSQRSRSESTWPSAGQCWLMWGHLGPHMVMCRGMRL
jgi:type II secretory pathway pseudopilin PulG